MIKKYSKWVLLVLCIFFVGMTPTFAREMTLDELEEELVQISPDASYIYVVGEYAFSSEHEFTRQDGMLAGRSIKVNDLEGKTNKDPIYNEMTIYRYIRLVDDYGDYVGLEYKENMVGTTKHPEVLDIKYIDYKYIGERSVVEVKPADAAALNEIKKDLGIDFANTGVEANVDGRNTNLTGTVSSNKTIGESIFPSEDLTGYYYAFTIDDLGENAVVTVEGVKTKTFNKDDFTNGRLIVLMALHPELGKEGRNIKVTVDADGDEELYAKTVYNIDYSAVEFYEYATTDLLTEESELYANDAVKNFLSTIKFDFTKTSNLTLKDGKLTGKILYNGEIGKEFSSLPKDITGYYFTYVLTVEGEVTDDTVITIPGEDGTKVVRKASFDDEHSIVITTAIDPLKVNKVIEINVDLDGDGKSNTYTIDYSAVEFESVTTTTLVTEESSIYAIPAVQQFLTGIKYDFSKVAELKLENGKLTGKVSYNGEIGSEFSSIPEDITGYYFAYVLRIDGELTDKSVITIPGNNGRKNIPLTHFDTKNEIVIATALNPESTNKVIEITVDLDGDGDKYETQTYTIDYSEVEFEQVTSPVEPEEPEEEETI